VKIGSSNYKAADGVSLRSTHTKNITTGKIVELKTKFHEDVRRNHERNFKRGLARKAII